MILSKTESALIRPNGSSIRESSAGRRRIIFGLWGFVELLKKRFALRCINLCPLVEPRIVDGDCSGDGQRFCEAEMFGGERPRLGLADPKQGQTRMRYTSRGGRASRQ